MTPAEIRIDEILSGPLLCAVDEEAAALFWLDGHGNMSAWRKTDDDTRTRYLERAREIVSQRLHDDYYRRWGLRWPQEARA